MKELFVVVDMQNDFLTGALENAAAVEITWRVVAAVKSAEARGATVVFTRDTHDNGYLETREGKRLPVPHCIVGTHGHEIIDELKPYANEHNTFDKPAFASVELARYAEREHFDEITLVGVCTDICVIANAVALKAVLPEANISVIADCCAGVTEQSHKTALDAMRALQIDII